MRSTLKDMFVASFGILVAIFVIGVVYIGTAHGRSPKSKFYDFQDQLIDGEIKKPTTLYTDSRKRVRFNRLLKLKKSFMYDLLRTSKERIFR